MSKGLKQEIRNWLDIDLPAKRAQYSLEVRGWSFRGGDSVMEVGSGNSGLIGVPYDIFRSLKDVPKR